MQLKNVVRKAYAACARPSDDAVQPIRQASEYSAKIEKRMEKTLARLQEHEQGFQKRMERPLLFLNRFIAWQNVLEYQMQWLQAMCGAAGSPALSDANGAAEKLQIMKYVNHVWLPLNEGTLVEHIDEQGHYQKRKYDAALRHVRGRGCAVDAGANVGLFSRVMSEDFEEVYAFEPVQSSRACILRNVRKNNVVVFPYALGECAEKKTITYSEHAGAGAMIDMPKELVDNLVGRLDVNHTEIAVRTLDSFHFSQVDFLKIDVQGFEDKLLRGAQETLKRCKPVVMVEVAARVRGQMVENEEVAVILSGLGYKEAERIGKDVVFVPET